MDWMVGPLDDEALKYVSKITESVDTILLGRKMTDVFISYWLDVMNKPDDRWYAFAKRMIEIPKVVFTKTTCKYPKPYGWSNVLLLKLRQTL